jgi:hypothetical protein
MRNYIELALERLGVHSYSIDSNGMIISLNNTALPNQEVIDAEVEKIKIERENNKYKRKRKSEYPPLEDYIDGVVKGDQEQIDAYIAACQAVKLKYPKPE